MLIKHIDVPGLLYDHNGIRSVMSAEDTSLMIKTAEDYSYTYSDEFLKAIEKYKKEVDTKKYMLASVIALGAGEWYSSNVNGDWFSEDTLLQIYKTFEGGYIYQNHVNKDPKKSIGRILFASYNHEMHRVELLISVDRTKGIQYVLRIENGFPVDMSFGYSTPYDKCSICGNEARSRAAYCEHLRFQMNAILPDGRKVYAINPTSGKFFEMSFVRKGAVRIAKVMEKVAHVAAHESISANIHKSAASKFASIVKEVYNNFQHSGISRDKVDAFVGMLPMFSLMFEPPLNPDIFKGFSLRESIGTISRAGIVPHEHELLLLLSSKLREAAELAEIAARRMRIPAEEFPCSPRLMQRMMGLGILEGRSMHTPFIRRVIRIIVSPSRIEPKIIEWNTETANLLKQAAGISPTALVRGINKFLYKNILRDTIPSHLYSLGESMAANKLLTAMIIGSLIAQRQQIPTVEFYTEGMQIPEEDIIKTSGFHPIKTLKFIALPFFGAQVLSSDIKRRQMEGRPVSGMENVIAKYPGTTGLLATVGALKAKKLLTPLFKGASIEKDALFLNRILPVMALTSKNPLSIAIPGAALDYLILGGVSAALVGGLSALKKHNKLDGKVKKVRINLENEENE